MNTPETLLDPIELQYQALAEILLKNLTPDELATPQGVIQLLQKEAVLLTELRVSRSEIDKLKSENSQLAIDREKLRVAEAGYQERVSSLFNQGWIEIPTSFLGGFAINLLSVDYKSGLGWFLLLISLVILGLLRIPQIANHNKGRK